MIRGPNSISAALHWERRAQRDWEGARASAIDALSYDQLHGGFGTTPEYRVYRAVDVALKIMTLEAL